MGSVVLNKSSEHNGAGALPGGNPAEWSGLRVRATELDCAFESLSLDDRLLGMRREVRGKIIFTTSFGLEDQMILDSLRRLQVDVDIVTLDTGRLFAETYALWAESEQRYGIRIRAVYPQHDAVEALIAAHGINGFYDSSEARKACCHARKVEPLNRALAGAAAWVTGIRAGQSNSRREVGLVDIDWDRGILKFNPLSDWARDAVLQFTRERNIPVNSLHAKGFASIGCAPCTRAIQPDEPERAGRWWWEQDTKKECGLHERSQP
jgi:phosphoadenosine phosphosulfate reductase